jgi:hypothetical protein
MFIRAVRKKNRGSDQVYSYHQRIEAVRTLRGPRQRILLNLGTLEIHPAEWKELANRIEAIYLGQQSLSPSAPQLESLAQHYAAMLGQQEFSRAAEAAQWETVDLASLSREMLPKGRLTVMPQKYNQSAFFFLALRNRLGLRR